MSLSVADIKKKLKGYRFGDQTARDVHALTDNFKTLKPQDMAPFVNPTGQRESLMCVKGTIPVAIRGVTYNIPIAIWLRNNHPYTNPVVYVTPTQGMGIQQSRYVDANGTVYLPYLSEWKHGSSDLTTLIQVMCATFVDHCPVYSKPAAPHQPQQPQWPPRPPPQQQQPPSSYHPGATAYPFPVQTRPPQSAYPGQQPAFRAPYPTTGGGMPTPTPPYSGGGYSPQQQAPPTSSYPPQQGQYPFPQPQSPAQPSPVPVQVAPATTVHSPVLTATPVGGGTAAALSEEEEKRQKEESAIIQRQSLESAVEDKIRRHVKQVLDAAQNEMESMLATQDKLEKGGKQITSMLEEMENKQREVDGSIDMLRSKNVELESILDYLRSQPEKVDVDSAVAATNPLYDQILQLYAEESAIDDTIYFLGEALRKEVIEVEVFLKHVRELSRQQFIARATIMKARSAARLAA